MEKRQQGLKGGMIGQVLVTAMVAEGEETALGALGGKWPDVVKPTLRRVFRRVFLSLCIRLPFCSNRFLWTSDVG